MKRKANEPGTALLVLRTLRGWSQAELAKASGIHHAKLSGFERGKKKPERETILRLVDAMGFDGAFFECVRVAVWVITSPTRRRRAGQRPEVSASPEASWPRDRAREA